MKQLPEEFKEFIQCLNSSKVKYLLIGGWAVGLHGHPRLTKDIDFLILIDSIHLNLLKKALIMFNAPPVDIECLRKKDNVIRFGVSPIQIDIIGEAEGIILKIVIQEKI